jgi:hypothetical protein
MQVVHGETTWKTKMKHKDIREIGYEDVKWAKLAQDVVQCKLTYMLALLNLVPTVEVM